MKKLIYFFFLLSSLIAKAQDEKIIISNNGIDSIKFGMTKAEVEKIINAPLNKVTLPYPDAHSHDSLGEIENYSMNYKKIPFMLMFSKDQSEDSVKLTFVMPLYSSSHFETKDGIKKGMSVKDFLSLCQKNNYPYKVLVEINNIASYKFSDDPQSSKKNISVFFKDGVLISMTLDNISPEF